MAYLRRGSETGSSDRRGYIVLNLRLLDGDIYIGALGRTKNKMDTQHF